MRFICWIRGHDYRVLAFHANHVGYCIRCGKGTTT